MIFNNSSADLLLRRRGAFLDEAVEVLAWGHQWSQFFGMQSGLKQAWVAQVDGRGTLHWISNYPRDVLQPSFPDELLQRAIKAGKIHVFPVPQRQGAGGLFPLEYEGRMIGLIGLLSGDIDYFNSDVIESVESLAQIMARGLFWEDYRARERQAEFSINRLLQSCLDARNIMPSILEILAEFLQADALIALSHNLSGMNIETLASHGWEESFPLSRQTIQAVKTFLTEKLPIWIDDLQDPDSDQQPIRRMHTAGFRGYLALPLIGHDEPSGSLEIVWLSPRKRQAEELSFLGRVAEQIAFVLERSTMVKDLRQAQQSLTSGYDALIEGLSRTLELRDFETVGHTRRVSLLTMRLLEHMKIPSEQWESIRRGALLHDIGKLGVPDAILLKPGSLTEEEKRMMQRHVIYGYNILTPFINSRQILDIVLHHHEHWDGTGYPDGLKGEQIPIVARLFAVVDVFDALASDRPYRTAWSLAQAMDYLREQAGRQFDPRVVGPFLEIAKDIP